jgi:hypothetical protein
MERHIQDACTSRLDSRGFLCKFEISSYLHELLEAIGNITVLQQCPVVTLNQKKSVRHKY